MNYPKDIKAFYMRLSDDGRTVAAMDVPAPGIGEIIGGSQREEWVEVLDRSMAKRGIDDHSIAIIALYIHGSERVRNHRMESATPDLDLTK
jgi:aspartyl/asparaginyl-tRNA synthetase